MAVRANAVLHTLLLAERFPIVPARLAVAQDIKCVFLPLLAPDVLLMDFESSHARCMA